MCIQSNGIFENSLISLHFLNKDISFDIPRKLKFEIQSHDGHSEGSVSQIFKLGPSFYVMQSRKKCFKKWVKVTRGRFLT